MTAARQCDICGTLFRPAPGAVSLEVHVATRVDRGGTVYSQGWDGVDCCPDCSAKVLAVIKPALDGFEDLTEPEDRDGQ